MATGEVDIAQLTEAQQLALQQFTSVTDQDLHAAVPVLQKCEWNVQIAIARFFDGEPPDLPAELPPHLPVPQNTRQQGVLQHELYSTRRPTLPALESAPRLAAQSLNQFNQKPPFLLSVFMTPVNIIYNLFSRSFNVFGYLFPFLPRLLERFTVRTTSRSSLSRRSGRRPLGPRDTTARFLREFEEDYGAHELSFTDIGYARAFDVAKRHLKFLLVLPLSPDHDDTPTFVKDTILSEPVVTFLQNPSNNIIIWAGSIQDSEAYQVACALNITKFPSAVLLVHTSAASSAAMSIVARISGPTMPEHFIAKLQAAIQQHSGALQQTRAARAEQQATRDLRDQQNIAYERSLAIDRERAKQRKEAQAMKDKQERAARENQESRERFAANIKQWRRWRVRRLLAEPGPEEKDIVRVSIRLPDGQRLVRKFQADASIEDLYALVECHGLSQEGGQLGEEVPKPPDFNHEYHFRLVSPMPREVYAIADGGTLKERIGRSGNLIVERIIDEEDDTNVDSVVSP